MKLFFKRAAFLFAIFLVCPFVFAADENYVLGPEDVINIYVWRHNELNFENLTIRPNGCISFPFTGEIMAAGLSCGSLEKSLSESLQPYIKNPKISVNVVKRRSYNIYVVGQVKTPGVYDLKKSKSSLSEALALSGGVTDKAALKRCLIQRKSDSIPVNLEEFLKSGETSQNIEIQENDIIVIPEMNFRVAVVGEVQKPGVYDLREGDTLLEALSTASWFNNKARVSSLEIIRMGNSGLEERIKVDFRGFKDPKNSAIFKKFALKNRDIVYVPTINGPTFDDISKTFNLFYFLRPWVINE